MKVGDTIADIKEGVNAKVWSVGVIIGSNEMALTETEKRMLDAGASYVIRTIEELPSLISLINKTLN